MDPENESTLYCHKCNSKDVAPTSSEQMRVVDGEKRLTADMVCGSCGHTWWSVHPDALELAREADSKRKEAHDRIDV